MYVAMQPDENGISPSLTEFPRPVPYQRWEDALSLVLDSLLSGTRLILVTGPAGTGKTLLLRKLYRALHDAGRSVRLESRGDILDKDDAPGPGEAILIDEADRLDPVLLVQLQQGGGALVLSGLNLSVASALPCSRRVVQLGPLLSEEIAPFVMARLTEVGRRPGLFSADALEHVGRYSGGVPRLLAMLVDASAWLADAEESGCVTADHVREAAKGRALGEVDVLPPEASILTAATPLPLAPEPPAPVPEILVDDAEPVASPLPAMMPPVARQPLSFLRPGRRFTVAGASACAAALLGVAVWWGSEGGSYLSPLAGTSTAGVPVPHRSTDAAPPNGPVAPGVAPAEGGARLLASAPGVNEPARAFALLKSLPDMQMMAEVLPPARPLPPVEVPHLRPSRPVTAPAAVAPPVPPLPDPSVIRQGLGHLSPPPQVAALAAGTSNFVMRPLAQLPPPPPAPPEAEVAGLEEQPGSSPAEEAGRAGRPATEPRSASPRRQAAASEVEPSRRRQAAPASRQASQMTGFSRRPVPAALDERDASAAEERCRSIVLSTQLGGELGSADLRFLRNRCRSG